ncbi:MAG TPA: alpha/beta fold hydrolase [Thermoanaerobaculia bacterium]|nr:alpha/beta fold hydrolase [Thermoanaerobaculia bacterium]
MLAALFALALTTDAKDVTLKNGTVVKVEARELQVPESRRRPTARRVTIPYYRLRSTAQKPASPIFLLAGGPGSSWLDQFQSDENFREVEYYRTIADVVLFDQRGAGHSRPSMTCPQTAQLPVDQPLDAAMLRDVMRPLLTACRDHWQNQGVDLAAYNTIENAADVNDLRIALGYDKIHLIGGSYGSHLALQFMRQFPKAVDRVVIYGVEGPDHTWDNPAGMLATLGRIAAEAERSPELSPHIPKDGLLKTLERVVARLEAAPQTVTIDATPVVVDANLVRRMARRDAGRRNRPNAWPEMILALDRGDYTPLAKGRLDNQEVRHADPMHYSMDCASGISEKRRQHYRDDPAASLLGNINFEYESLCDLWPTENLGDSFRRDVKSNIPTLIVHGTFDMSTPIENAREVAASLRNVQLVEVVGGTHGALYNLYERWPPMHEMLAAFLSGKNVRFPRTIVDPREVKFRALERQGEAAWKR